MTSHRTPISLEKLYRVLLEAQGHQRWWPADSVDEIIMGAILTQSVSWSNVEKALGNLREAGIHSLRDLGKHPASILAGLIRPALYYNQKAKKLKSFSKFCESEFGCDPALMFETPLPLLRSKLLELWGLGPETVDSILLYAGSMPVFVIDAYTNRLLWRLGHVPELRTYSGWQRYISERIPVSVPLYQDFHAQIVVVCKNHCRKNPVCITCPLAGLCNMRLDE